MRGLAVFISDIRNCKSKEAEIKRINKELANIRSKFKVKIIISRMSMNKLVGFWFLFNSFCKCQLKRDHLTCHQLYF